MGISWGFNGISYGFHGISWGVYGDLVGWLPSGNLI
jgi:hypothetical protein